MVPDGRLNALSALDGFLIAGAASAHTTKCGICYGPNYRVVLAAGCLHRQQWVAQAAGAKCRGIVCA